MLPPGRLLLFQLGFCGVVGFGCCSQYWSGGGAALTCGGLGGGGDAFPTCGANAWGFPLDPGAVVWPSLGGFLWRFAGGALTGSLASWRGGGMVVCSGAGAWLEEEELALARLFLEYSPPLVSFPCPLGPRLEGAEGRLACRCLEHFCLKLVEEVVGGPC